MKTIIAPIDFSPVTNRVATAAIKLARLLKGRVVFLHVVPPPSPIRNILPAIEDVKLRTVSTGNEADKKLTELKHALQRKFHEMEFIHVSGAPVTCIVEQAQKLEAEYLVIGSHGHSAMHDVLMGSVASGVVKKAPCPVLLVPSIAAPAEPAVQVVHELAPA